MAITAVGADTTDSGGTQVTSNGSAHTKGSYTELTASTGSASDGFLLTLGRTNNAGTDALDVRFLVDIATGAAGAETVVHPDAFFNNGNQRSLSRSSVPRAIATSTRIAARCQDATGGLSIEVALHLWEIGTSSLSALGTITTYGATTASTRGTTLNAGAVANTKGTYVQLTSSTSQATHMVEVVSINNNSAYIDAKFLLDLATGAAGAETVVLPNLPYVTSSSSTKDNWLSPMHTPPVPLAIATATRLAARIQSTSTGAGSRIMDAIVHATGA